MVPQMRKAQNVGLPLTTKTLSKVVPPVFHLTYGLLTLTISHHTIVMAHYVKSHADCSQPPLCLSYACKFLP